MINYYNNHKINFQLTLEVYEFYLLIKFNTRVNEDMIYSGIFFHN